MKKVLWALAPLLFLLLCPLPARAADDARLPKGRIAAELSDEDPTPTPIPSPDPAAGPTPSPAIAFVLDSSLPLPCPEYPITEKRGFAYGGEVVCPLPLLRVSVTVSDEAGSALLTVEKAFEPEEGVTSLLLRDPTYPFEDASLSALTDFASLAPGTYTFSLRAASTGEADALLYEAPFTVVPAAGVHTLIPNDLRGTYEAALTYLGPDALPFPYTLGTFGQIQIDGRWLSRNFTTIQTPFNAAWRVNKAAAENFRQALSYLRSTYLRVDGKWDSGVIRLDKLIRSYGGPLIPRFEENTPFLSPHVLGLAVDLNQSTGLNEAVPDNWATFCKEISENLIYNGIREKNGLPYYDFTYTGDWGTEYAQVPTILQNYLIYELAFYRAGFFWGVYYDHTCDASHFGLGELDPAIHTDSPLALRKVYEYIGE